MNISPAWERKDSTKSKKNRVPYRIHPRTNMLRHILIKLTKIKHKERILKAEREEKQETLKGTAI